MLGALLAAAAQIRARVPVGAARSPDRFHSDALTRWQDRRWRPGSAAGRCRASEASVTLPIDPAPACREQGHAGDVRAHSQAVVRAIRGSDCRTANAAGDRQLDLNPRHDVACEAATHHGAMQGARFL